MNIIIPGCVHMAHASAKEHESYVGKMYSDPVTGNPLIGYGVDLTVHELPEDLAAKWSLRIMLEKYNQVRRVLAWIDDLPIVAQSVITELAYQMGTNGLLEFKNTLKYIRQGKYAKAADELLRGSGPEGKSLLYCQTPTRAVHYSNRLQSLETNTTNAKI